MNDSPQTPESTPAPAAASVSPAAAPPAPVEWETLGLSDTALGLVKKAGFKYPTPVQAQTIPEALQGFDVISSAQTGTGKTASFVLPMAEKFVGREGTYGLILAPTREIAQQIQTQIELFAGPRGIRSIVLIGGIDMRHDTTAIATYPQIIVATPGRLCDHLDRGNIWLDYVEVVVLDEADRMLDMGFTTQLNRIMDDVPKKRQTMLFSATFPPYVEKFAMRILTDPKRIAIGRESSAATTVDQNLLFVQEESKLRELLKIMRNETGSIMVFTRSKDGATRLWRSLHSAGIYDATFIHSDRMQSQREQALADFKEGKFRLLIATDVAARGLHVDDVAHVVNYDLPFEAENYVHRIGRTGRAGQTGKATTFITPKDRNTLRDIEKMLGREIPSLNGRGFDESATPSRGGGRGGRNSSQASGREQSSGDRPRPKPSGPVQALGAGPARVIAPRATPIGGAAPGGTERKSNDAPSAEGSGPSKRRGRRGGRGRNGGGGNGGESGAGSSGNGPAGTPTPAAE